MKILSDVRLYFVIITISFLSLLVNYLNLKDELTKCQTSKEYIPGGDIQKAALEQTIDSLESEVFIKSTEVGRYEITLEWLKETNPKAHQEFENYLTTQTE